MNWHRPVNNKQSFYNVLSTDLCSTNCFSWCWCRNTFTLVYPSENFNRIIHFSVKLVRYCSVHVCVRMDIQSHTLHTKVTKKKLISKNGTQGLSACVTAECVCPDTCVSAWLNPTSFRMLSGESISYPSSSFHHPPSLPPSFLLSFSIPCLLPKAHELYLLPLESADRNSIKKKGKRKRKRKRNKIVMEEWIHTQRERRETGWF